MCEDSVDDVRARYRIGEVWFHFVGTVSSEPKEEEEEEGPLLKGSGGEVSLSIEETK